MVKYGVCEHTIYRWTQSCSEINSSGKRTFTAKEYDIILCRANKFEDIVSIMKTDKTSHSYGDCQNSLNQIHQPIARPLLRLRFSF